MRRFEINPKYQLQHVEESIAEQAQEIERYTQFIKNLEGFLFKLLPFANAVEKISKNFYETFSSRTYVETIESLQNELRAMIDYLAKVKWSPAHQELKEKSWIPALENCLPLLNKLLDTQLAQISETVKRHEAETLPALNGSLNTIKEQILNNITILAKLRHKYNKKMQELIQEKQALTSTHESSAKQQKSKEQQESMEEGETGTLEIAYIEDAPTFIPSKATMTTEDQFSRVLSRVSSLYRSLRQLQAYMMNDDASLGQHHGSWQMFSKSLFMFIDDFEATPLTSDLSEYQEIVLNELKKCWDNMKNIITLDPSQRIANAAILTKVAVHLWNAKNAIKTQQEISQGKRPAKVKDQLYEERDQNAVIAIALGQDLLNTKDINKFLMLATVFMSLPETARELSSLTDRKLERLALKLINGVNDVVVFDRFLVDAINNKTLFLFELFLLAAHKTELSKLFIQQLNPAVDGMNFSTMHYDLSATTSSPFANAVQTNQFVSLLAWIIDSEWIRGLDYLLDFNGLRNQKDGPNVVTLTAYTPPPTGTNLAARPPIDRYTFFEYALKNERYQVLAYLIKNSLVPDDAAKKLINSKSLRDVKKQKLLIKLLLTNSSYFSPGLIELAIKAKNPEVLQLLLDGFQSYYQDMDLVCTHLEKATVDLSIFNQVLDTALNHYRSNANDMVFLNMIVTNPTILNLLAKEKEIATIIFLPLLEQDRLSESLIDSLRKIICARMNSMNDFFEFLQSIPQKHFTTVLHEIFTSDFILQYPEVLEFALLAKEEGDSKLTAINSLILKHIENLEKFHETKTQKKRDTMYHPPSPKAEDTILHRAIRRCLPHAYEYIIGKAPDLSLRTNGEGKRAFDLLHTNGNWPSIIRDNREKRFAKIFAELLKIESTEIHFWDSNSQLKPLVTTMQASSQDKKHPIPTLKSIGSKHSDISNPSKLRKGDIVVAFCANIDELKRFKTNLYANPNITSLLIIPPSLAKKLPKELYYELQQKYRCLGPVIANDTDLEHLTKTLLASLERLTSYFKNEKLDEPVKKIEDFMTADEKEAVEAEIEEREAFKERKLAFELLSQYIDDQCKKPDTKGFKLWKQLTSGSSQSEDIEAAVKLRNYLLGLDLSLNAEDNLKPFYAAFTKGELADVFRRNTLLGRILKNLSYSGPGRQL